MTTTDASGTLPWEPRLQGQAVTGYVLPGGSGERVCLPTRSTAFDRNMPWHGEPSIPEKPELVEAGRLYALQLQRL